MWTYGEGQKLKKIIEKSNSLHQTYVKVKEEKVYDIIKLKSVQRRYFAQFGCSYNTYGWFSRIFSPKIFWRKFSISRNFAFFRFNYFLENFPIFSRIVLFAANPSCYTIKRKFRFIVIINAKQTGLPTKVYNCFSSNHLISCLRTYLLNRNKEIRVQIVIFF